MKRDRKEESMSHVDEGTLHAYLDGELSSSERAAVDAHLGQCGECRAALAEERALLERARALLASAPPRSAPAPCWARRARAGARPRRSSSSAASFARVRRRGDWAFPSRGRPRSHSRWALVTISTRPRADPPPSHCNRRRSPRKQNETRQRRRRINLLRPLRRAIVRCGSVRYHTSWLGNRPPPTR